jgi:hypothetical protein
MTVYFVENKTSWLIDCKNQWFGERIAGIIQRMPDTE